MWRRVLPGLGAVALVATIAYGLLGGPADRDWSFQSAPLPADFTAAPEHTP
jgi:hypothetical protein